MTESKLEKFYNMVEKNLIEYHQRNGSYSVPGIMEISVLVDQTQETDNGIIPTPSEDDSPLTAETQLHDEWDRDIDTHKTRTCDIATELKVFKEFQVSERISAIMSDFNGQTSPLDNNSENSLTSVSLISILTRP